MHWVNTDPGGEQGRGYDASVMPYIGRSGWNTLAFGGSIPDEELLEAVDESYRLVVDGLPKKLRPEGWGLP